MKLNYRLRISKKINKNIPIILIHGLFGNLNNLNTLAVYLAKYYNIIQIDLRNHGYSPHHEIMTYTFMAQDILELLNYFFIEKCIIIGHSMGGKVAMAFNILFSERITKTVVIDIAPIKYNIKKKYNIFRAINHINYYKIKNKNSVIDIMRKYNINFSIIGFLLKSFQNGLWRFNFNFIKKNYTNINNWIIFNQPCYSQILFLKGELSSYISDIYIKDIYTQFPSACIQTIPNAGHWVHCDNPKFLFNTIHQFILN